MPRFRSCRRAFGIWKNLVEGVSLAPQCEKFLRVGVALGLLGPIVRHDDPSLFLPRSLFSFGRIRLLARRWRIQRPLEDVAEALVGARLVLDRGLIVFLGSRHAHACVSTLS